MRVRAATPDDVDAIARVHVETWRSAYRGLVPDEYLAGLSPARRADQWRAFLGDRGAARVLVVVRLPSMLLWVLEANVPARAFYEALGGIVVRHQPIEIGGATLTEIAYGWADLAPLLQTAAT